MNDKNNNIIQFVGKGYSKYINEIDTDIKKLKLLNLPLLTDDLELANFLNIKPNKLKFLCYFKRISDYDNYFCFLIPKKSSGYRKISAPKPILKTVQKLILHQILVKIYLSENAWVY